MDDRTDVTHLPSDDLKRAAVVNDNGGEISGLCTVGIVSLVLGLVVVGVATGIVFKVWYRRRIDKRLDNRASFSSTNPLYDDIQNQEKELAD
jgi:uncharacterized ion transporter superfamily protein YfcC